MSGWPEKSGLSTDSDGRMASPRGGSRVRIINEKANSSSPPWRRGPRANGPFCRESLPYPSTARIGAGSTTAGGSTTTGGVEMIGPGTGIGPTATARGEPADCPRRPRASTHRLRRATFRRQAGMISASSGCSRSTSASISPRSGPGSGNASHRASRASAAASAASSARRREPAAERSAARSGRGLGLPGWLGSIDWRQALIDPVPQDAPGQALNRVPPLRVRCRLLERHPGVRPRARPTSPSSPS